MNIGTFLKSSLLVASLLCVSALPVAAQQGGGAGGAGGGRGMLLTQEQRTQMRDAISGDIAPLREKLNTAHKELMKAVMAKASDETLKAKIEAVHKVQADMILVQIKGFKAITLTSEQKSRLEEAADGGFNQVFGMGMMGGRGGRRGGAGAGGGNN